MCMNAESEKRIARIDALTIAADETGWDAYGNFYIHRFSPSGGELTVSGGNYFERRTGDSSDPIEFEANVLRIDDVVATPGEHLGSAAVALAVKAGSAAGCNVGRSYLVSPRMVLVLENLLDLDIISRVYYRPYQPSRTAAQLSTSEFNRAPDLCNAQEAKGRLEATATAESNQTFTNAPRVIIECVFEF